MKDLEIFNCKGEHKQSLENGLIAMGNSSCNTKNIISNLTYLIENFPENSPYFDNSFYQRNANSTIRLS